MVLFTLDVTGNVSGAGTGTIKGKNCEISTGFQITQKLRLLLLLKE